MRQITEKIVTFETARIAERLGFSAFSEQQLKKGYCVVSTWYDAEGKLHEDHENGVMVNYVEKGEYKKWETIIEAPSQSVLQTWLRERWHVHPHIWFDDENYEDERELMWRASIYLLSHNAKQGGLVSKPELGPGFKTYEERLELALQEMLYFVQLDCPVKRSSDDWQKMYPDPLVMDPDGWDRSNFEESWQEPITYKEYINRLIGSTCKFIGQWGKKVVKA